MELEEDPWVCLLQALEGLQCESLVRCSRRTAELDRGNVCCARLCFLASPPHPPPTTRLQGRSRAAVGRALHREGRHLQLRRVAAPRPCMPCCPPSRRMPCRMPSRSLPCCPPSRRRQGPGVGAVLCLAVSHICPGCVSWSTGLGPCAECLLAPGACLQASCCGRFAAGSALFAAS